MSLVSSNPQDLAQEMDDYLEQGWSCPPDARRMMAQAVTLLRAKDLEVDGHAVRPIPRFPEGALVDKVAAALNGYRHQLGPNAIFLIRDGVWKSLPLSLGEMRDIAWLLQEAGLLKEDR